MLHHIPSHKEKLSKASREQLWASSPFPCAALLAEGYSKQEFTKIYKASTPA